MSESSGDIPDWLRQHTETPSKIFLCSSSSDEDDIPLIRRAAVTSGAAQQPQAAHPQPETAAGAAPVPAPVQPSHAPGDGDGDDDVPATQPQTQPVGPSQQLSAPPPSSAKRGLPASQRQAGGPSLAVPGVAAGSGQLPIMLPEKLNRSKVLLELPYVTDAGEGHCHGAADLSGDSGAVGRVVVLTAGSKGGAAAGPGGSGSAGGCELQVDLKGVVYNAWVLPLAGTAMVFNIQPSEVKVESLFNDFVRLREAGDQYGTDADGEGLAYLLDGDDENYQIGGGGEGDEGPGPSAPKAGKAGKGGKAGTKSKAAGGSKAAQAAKPKKKAGSGAGGDKKAASAKKAGGGGGAKRSGKAALGVKGGGVKKKSGAAAAAATKKKAGPGAGPGKKKGGGSAK